MVELEHRNENALYYEQVYDTELQIDLENAHNRCIGRCPECGGIDGMETWYHWNVSMLNDSRYEPPEQFYQADKSDALYATCPVCNPQGIIPDGYKPIAISQARDWAIEQEALDHHTSSMVQ